MARNTPSSTDNDSGYELNTDSISSGASSSSASSSSSTSSSKGRPTPTRKEKEDALKRPLVSSDRAEARRTSKASMQVERDRQRIGMANGDEKYLPLRDRGPQKRFVRDFVDARTSVGEFLIPLMFIVIILTFFPEGSIVPVLGIGLLWVFFALIILDSVWLGFQLKRRLGAKFGESKVTSGYRWYATMRAAQLRLMRLPKPQVKRGQYPA